MSESLPQDSRGPHRQQRWVSCKNVGSQTIPAYGVVQVVDASRVEVGRTIIHVKRPTMDGHCNILINSPMPIAEGAFGICTNDFPTYALYGDDTPAVSEVWGSKANAFTLKKNKRGFIILGDPDGLKVRINRDPRDWLIAEAELNEDLCGAVQVSVQVVNAKLLPTCIEFTPLMVTNRRFHRGEKGARILMVKRACSTTDPCGGDEEWDIFDIEQREVCVMVGLESRVSCLVMWGLKTGQEYCPTDEPVKACVIVEYTKCVGTLPACETAVVFDPIYVCCGQWVEPQSGPAPTAPPTSPMFGPGPLPWQFVKP